MIQRFRAHRVLTEGRDEKFEKESLSYMFAQMMVRNTTIEKAIQIRDFPFAKEKELELDIVILDANTFNNMCSLVIAKLNLHTEVPTAWEQFTEWLEFKVNKK